MQKYSSLADIDVANSARINNSEINVGPYAKLTVKPRAIIDECHIYVKTGGIVEIGDRVRLEGITLKVRKPNARFKIGNKSIINKRSLIINDRSIEIGNYVLIARNVLITDSQIHSLDWKERREEIDQLMAGKPRSLNVRNCDLKISDDCWLGYGSQVLVPKRGSEELILGRGTIVAASAVVKESFKDGFQIIAGAPAKLIRYLEARDISTGS